MEDDRSVDPKDRLSSQQNWLKWQQHKSEKKTVVWHEYPLFTDARFTGQRDEEMGPYQFLNSVPMPGVQRVNAALYLRVKFFLDYQNPDMTKTNETLYFGGQTIADELAPLVSLALGSRIQAGDASKEFGEVSDDPLGLPRESWYSRKPELPPEHRYPILPDVIKGCSVEPLDILESIPKIKHDRYVNLVRAAKAYQSALWMAETDVNFAWLLLVSALETAARDEVLDSNTPEGLLREARPALAVSLEKAGGPELLVQAAQAFSPLLQSTKRFLSFVMRFLPQPPAQRPSGATARIDWCANSIRKKLEKVYSYRSRYLHAAKPFPAPMLDFTDFRLTNPPPEVPLLACARRSHGATWKAEDLPVNLHCFHYIARGALINWWKRSLVNTE